LFGHEKGSFTGADKKRNGLVTLADNGTLFLDEIGELPKSIQASFLRVIQEKKFRAVGGEQELHSNFRVIAATNKDLDIMVNENRFRQDLFFRLSVVPVELPPLRQRSGDIPDLARHFLKRYREKNHKDIKGLHPQALNLLMRYNWPGNIRELENCIERAVVLCLGEEITPRELPPQINPMETLSRELQNPGGPTLRDMEREMIRNTLEETGNNKSQTARILGIARQTLLNKLKEYSLF
ncbi:MAG: sigma-54-dependent Fis family transcriptional regulator, partial [Desulfobulbaceae bacterium]|nr:sigma-54-dependent Fis family transcriptional regulator [Desulfobulbaceae bacterium]